MSCRGIRELERPAFVQFSRSKRVPTQASSSDRGDRNGAKYFLACCLKYDATRRFSSKDNQASSGTSRAGKFNSVSIVRLE